MSFVRRQLLNFTNTFFPERDKAGNIFYPIWFSGRNSNPDWIKIDDVSAVYECIPHLKIVINRKASMFSNMKFKAVDPDTFDPIDNTATRETLRLLKQPNPLQSQQHWLGQFKIYEQLYGAGFAHMVRGRSDMLPTVIWNLPSALMEVKLTGKIYNQTELSDIITKYELQQSNDKTLDFKVEEIILIRLMVDLWVNVVIR